MSNVFELFPIATDEEYENQILPILTTVLGQFTGAASKGRHKEVCEISVSLLDYSIRSMLFLDSCRKGGLFKDNKFPDVLSSAIDELAADSALALGGEDAKEVAAKLRNRSPTKRSKI